jgi:hypothetical protein
MQFASLRTLKYLTILSPAFLLSVVFASAIGWLVIVIVKGWKARSVFVELQKQDLVYLLFSTLSFH